ncbi:unnamed protein product, partial [Didymodactylos carnosus]
MEADDDILYEQPVVLDLPPFPTQQQSLTSPSVIATVVDLATAVALPVSSSFPTPLQPINRAIDIFEHDSLDGTFTDPDFNQEHTSHICPTRVVQRQWSLCLQNSAEVVELPSAVTTSFQRSSPVQPVMNQQSSQPIRSSVAPPTPIANQQQS